MVPATVHTPSKTPWDRTSSTNAPAPTRPKPTEKLNGSTAPCSRNGLTRTLPIRNRTRPGVSRLTALLYHPRGHTTRKGPTPADRGPNLRGVGRCRHEMACPIFLTHADSSRASVWHTGKRPRRPGWPSPCAWWHRVASELTVPAGSSVRRNTGGEPPTQRRMYSEVRPG